jgi:hypothetical protein
MKIVNALALLLTQSMLVDAACPPYEKEDAQGLCRR